MVQVYEEPISRRHYAPYFSVAFLYRPVCVGKEGRKVWGKKSIVWMDWMQTAKNLCILRPTPP